MNDLGITSTAMIRSTSTHAKTTRASAADELYPPNRNRLTAHDDESFGNGSELRDRSCDRESADPASSRQSFCQSEGRGFMSVRRLLLISAIVFLEALLVHFFLAQRSPLSGDDYSYLYQAKLFASGKLYAEDPIYNPSLPFYDCIETYCLRDDQGHRFSQYPPGWPALLAVGVKLRAPWLVDPLLGALLIFLILKYVEQRMGKELVRVTSLLLLL